MFRFLLSALALNFVVILTGQAAPGTTRTWSGAAFPLTNWANGLNWGSGAIPMTGDDLVFPPDVPGMTNFNNLPAGTTFNLITLGGPGYSLSSGTPLVLAGGLAGTNASGVNTIQSAIAIGGEACAISNAAGGTLILNGPINLNGHPLAMANAGSVFVFNSITNQGGLTKLGTGTLQLSRANAYDGPTFVVQGRVIVLDNAALGLTTTGTVVAAGAELQIFNGRTIAEPLELGGTLSSGLSTTNVWTGPIILIEDAAVFAVNSGGTLHVASQIKGSHRPHGFRKTQGGELRITGSNTFTGPTVIESGMLSINGSQPGSAVTVAPGGILRGLNGTCGAVSNSPFGAIRPGDAVTPGTLNIEGGLTCVAFSAVELRIFDGLSLDRLNVTGPVNLGGATLLLQLTGATPPSGAAFEIISNDGSDPVAGTFAGLPEGALASVVGLAFQISYAGGDGNDVVLTRVSEPSLVRSISTTTNGLSQIDGLGLPNVRYVLEATPNFDTTPVSWMPIATNAANGAGVYQFIDQDTAFYPTRFYRVLSP